MSDRRQPCDSFAWLAFLVSEGLDLMPIHERQIGIVG